ncbi:hypothetical protein [Sphingomonas sp. TREG-RG-20F-R18-01]|uniref:head-tail connector protein n=1 Tax=Sphingomonas sp. TREG-RG-20F-R18-01 TaxID=2914982 RepID=UPI001F56BA62|nr:hypothetical protein [Sphingomonas sp. TREG-RG-20F-R18-01]
MIDGNGPGVVTLGAGDRALALVAVKAVLRVASDTEDDLLVAFVETALGLAERFLGQVTIARTMRACFAPARGWQRISAAPVRAISVVETRAGTPLDPAGYAIDIDPRGDGWVRVIDPAADEVVLGFDCGLAADWPGLPGPIRQGVVLLAAHLFVAREGSTPPPLAVTALWRPFRRIAVIAGDHPC